MSIKGKNEMSKIEKVNQDALITALNFDNIKNQHIIGAFDGHGIEGQHVSKFAVDHLEDYLKYELQNENKQSIEVL